VSTLKEEDIKSFKLSPGWSKKLLLAAQQVADKLLELKMNRKSAYLLSTQYPDRDALPDIDFKLQNEPVILPTTVQESPGTVHGSNGFCLCVETFLPRKPNTSFLCNPGGKAIIVNLVNSQQKPPSYPYSIRAMWGPSGKVYKGTPAGYYDGYYSASGPSGNIVLMGITESKFELGMWYVQIDQLNESPDKKIPNSAEFFIANTVFLVCSVISDTDFKTYGKDIYNACQANSYCSEYMKVLELPINPEIDLDCSISKLVMGPLALSLFYPPSTSTELAYNIYLFLATRLLGRFDIVSAKLVIDTADNIRKTKDLIFVLWFLCRSLGRCRNVGFSSGLSLCNC